LEQKETLAELQHHQHQQQLPRLAKLEEKEEKLAYCDQTKSSSLDFSNYDTTPGSLETSATKT